MGIAAWMVICETHEDAWSMSRCLGAAREDVSQGRSSPLPHTVAAVGGCRRAGPPEGQDRRARTGRRYRVHSSRWEQEEGNRAKVTFSSHHPDECVRCVDYELPHPRMAVACRV